MYIKWQVFVCTYIDQWTVIIALHIHITFAPQFIYEPHALHVHVITMQYNLKMDSEHACTYNVNNRNMNLKRYKCIISNYGVLHVRKITIFIMTIKSCDTAWGYNETTRYVNQNNMDLIHEKSDPIACN